MQCKKCKDFFPPGFVEEDKCLFCIRETNTIVYENGAKKIKKKELIKEYQNFLKEIRDRNDILKKATRGDFSGVSEKLIIT
jgi:hypothetical protein